MELKDLYPAVLTFVLIAVLIGVGLYVLDTIGSRLTGAGGDAVNDTRDAIATFVPWFSIIIVIIAAAIIIGLVVRSFSGR